jgi:hypothetical protein
MRRRFEKYIDRLSASKSVNFVVGGVSERVKMRPTSVSTPVDIRRCQYHY